MGSSSDWHTITKNFSSDYYCIVVDLPGHGNSEIDEYENSYNMENTAQYIIDLLESNKLEKCNLLGYSMGGRISLRGIRSSTTSATTSSMRYA